MKKILLISFLLISSLQLFAQNTSAAPKKKGVLPETLFNLDFNGSLSGFNSFLDVSIMPVKALIGSKNTGIIVGFQSFEFGSNQFLTNYPRFQTSLFYPAGVYDIPYDIQANYQTSTLDQYSVNEGWKKGRSIRLGYQKSIVRGLYANVSLDICRIKTDVSHLYLVDYKVGGFNYKNKPVEQTELSRKIWGMRVNAGLGYTISIGKAKKFYLNYELVYSIIDKSKSTQGKLNFIGGIGFRIGSPAKTSFDGIKEVNTVIPFHLHHEAI
jgi:hypothetical protein